MYDDFNERDWTAGFRSRRTWIRGFFMLLFLVVLWFARLLLTVVAVFQFGAHLIAQRPVARLLPFGRSLGAWLRQIADFLTYNTEDKPFPFAPWPDPGESDADRLYEEDEEDEDVTYPPIGTPFPPEPEPEEEEPEAGPEEEPTAEEAAEEETNGEEEAEAEEEEEEDRPDKNQPPRPDA